MSEDRPYRHVSAIDGQPEIDPGKKPAPVDVGDRKSVNEARKAAKQNLSSQDEVVRRMMSIEDQRKWFCELLTMCHILHNPFSESTIRMAFSCGEMNIGQIVFVQLQRACPDLYNQMMKEANDAPSA